MLCEFLSTLYICEQCNRSKLPEWHFRTQKYLICNCFIICKH